MKVIIKIWRRLIKFQTIAVASLIFNPSVSSRHLNNISHSDGSYDNIYLTFLSTDLSGANLLTFRTNSYFILRTLLSLIRCFKSWETFCFRKLVRVLLFLRSFALLNLSALFISWVSTISNADGSCWNYTSMSIFSNFHSRGNCYSLVFIFKY